MSDGRFFLVVGLLFLILSQTSTGWRSTIADVIALACFGLSLYGEGFGRRRNRGR